MFSSFSLCRQTNGLNKISLIDINIAKQHCLAQVMFSEDRPVLYDATLSPALGKSSNGENGYYQYIWDCFNKWSVHRLHAG